MRAPDSLDALLAVRDLVGPPFDFLGEDVELVLHLLDPLEEVVHHRPGNEGPLSSGATGVPPELPRFRKGGLDNPLGARALYLYQNGRDILFRIHGTIEPWTIGKQVSSGCIRMLNEDILDLYDRVPVGTPVLVRRTGHRRV
jgi:hypothetical protein